MMTCEEVAAIYPDDNEASDPRRPDITNRYRRHLMFARWVLGERFVDAVYIAMRFRTTPLPLEAMRHLAEHWADEDYDGPTGFAVAGLESDGSGS